MRVGIVKKGLVGYGEDCYLRRTDAGMVDIKEEKVEKYMEKKWYVLHT